MHYIEPEVERVLKDHSAQAPGRSNLLPTTDFGVRRCAGVYIYVMYIVFIVPIFDMNKCKYAKLTGGVLARVPVLVLVHTFTLCCRYM